MSKASRPDRDELHKQARQHLQSLKAAGVEWLPTAPAPRIETAPELPAPESVLASVPTPMAATVAPAASTLFGEVAEQPLSPAAAPTMETLTPEQRRHELAVLGERVSTCTRCAALISTRHQTVFGEGPLDVELCFIGEAPGEQEDLSGRPFVGPAGQLLTRIITACGFKREEVYILNILKCRPPNNRTPAADEAANCREYLERQLELVRPRYICCLGGTAAQNLLGTTLSISRLHGTFQNYRGITVQCTYHPSYLLTRAPEKKRDVWEDMKRLLRRMGRPVPGENK